MRKMFIKYFVIVMICAMFGMIFANNAITDRLAERYANQEAHNTVSQVLSKLSDNRSDIAETERMLGEDTLARCRTFRYLAHNDDSILTDTEKIKEIAALLGVDELVVVDSGGIVSNSSNEKEIGYDMKSSEQSIEFMKLFLGLTSELTQDTVQRGFDGLEFRYAGVASEDGENVLIAGMRPDRYRDLLEKSSLTGFISKNAITDARNYVYIIDIETGKYLDHSDKSLIGAPISQEADALAFYEAFKNGGTYTYLGSKYYNYAEKTGDTVIGVSYDYQNITALMTDARIVSIAGITVIFLLLIIFISLVVDIKLVRPIKRIISDMNEISEGNMDKFVEKQSLPELEQLSTGINNMKQSIICDSNKISGIISAANIPIAVYEMNPATGKCSMTGNFRRLYALSDSEAEDILSDDGKIMRFIEENSSELEEGEENIFRIKDKNRWVKIEEMRNNGNIFCIVTDATDFMLEKKHIQNERDIDSLTDIHNRRSFEKTVSRLMKSGSRGKKSAMLMIDLDDFKSINDTYGHAFGDAYLKFTASCMKFFTDERVIAGRRSGDEFYMYFCGFDSREEILLMMNAVRDYINDNAIESPKGPLKVKFSAGAAFGSDAENDFDSLLDKADEMLYKAKRERKGTIVVNEE